MKKIFIIHILLTMPLLAWCDNITFADAEVKAICVKNWDTNGDGELSYEEVASVKALGDEFRKKTSIKMFDELHYFTGLTYIRYAAFEGCSSLTSITIPNSVTSIGTGAFEGCSSLTSVTIPNSVTSIGGAAFRDCSSLTSVTIPNSVTSIGNYAFYCCRRLISITIPNSVTSIGDHVFYGCSSLTSVTIPSSVTSIGNDAFEGCRRLISITIPNSVTSIGDYVFYGCSSLTSVTIPSSVTSIGRFAFYACNSLTSIEIPNSVTLIGWGAFQECSSLISVIIPNSVTSIEGDVFSLCRSLTSVSIPNSVTSIGEEAFYACNSLTSIIIPNSVTTIGSQAFYDCNSLTSITIPNSVTSIGLRAFINCNKLKSIKVESTTPFEIRAAAFSSRLVIFVPKGCKEAYQSADVWKNYTISDQNPDEAIVFADTNVKEICVKNWDTNDDGELSYGEAAAVSSVQQVFRNNTDITSFDEFQYFYGMESIGEYAFDKCTNLKSVKLPDYLKEIGSYAFGSCKALKSIVIPKSVNNITGGINYTEGHEYKDKFYYNPFLGCNSLESIVVESGNETFDSRDNCNAIIDKSTNTLVSGCKNTVIPNSVSIIGFTAFLGCDGLISIVIPKNVSKIQSGAFADAKNLSIITLDGGVKIFGYTRIISNYCYGKVNKGTFDGCPNLEKVIVKNLADWSKSQGGNNGPLYYAHHLYSDENTEILDLVIPNGVDSIGYGAFQGCSYLKSVTIPNSVNVINADAFQGCTNLVSVSIPNSLTEIGTSAFSNCPKLSAIIWDADIALPNYFVSENTTNMLFYTKDASYAPSNIKNVIVNGTAKEIVLSDASSSNNFYCPREFTAEKISYTHNYRMTSGIDGQARGWETIALPFTVSEITHSSKGKLLPFGAWTSTSDAKPFWLCKLSSSGFTRAISIEANTPYIICMPNNSDYDSSFNLSGNVTFSATNVKVPVSSSLATAKSNDKSFIPAFCAQDKSSTVYALNVNNSYHSELGGYTEGSAFVSDLRKVSPFEAYMTTSAANAKRAFLIDFSETTGIDEVPTTGMKDGMHMIYNLNGQLVKQTNSQQELDETLKQLPAGVYVVNGKKTIIK